MPNCDTCGGEIEFRYIDGRCVPIHLNGGCSAGSGYGYTWGSGAGLFRESSRGTPFVFQYTHLISYAAPNAHCPVCGEPVFFYESPFGGRVFFDELGPPWLKHPCTENDKNLAAFIRTTDRERLTARFKAAAPVELDSSLAKQTAAATPPEWSVDGWFPFLVEDASVTSVGLQMAGRRFRKDGSPGAQMSMGQLSVNSQFRVRKDAVSIGYSLTMNGDSVLLAMTEEIVYLRPAEPRVYDVSSIHVSQDHLLSVYEFQLQQR